jgi:hypothetical protein
MSPSHDHFEQLQRRLQMEPVLFEHGAESDDDGHV